MKIKDYSTINKSTTADYRRFKLNLREEYKDLIEVNLTNESGNKFLISPSYIAKWETKFSEITKHALKLRETNKDDYLKEGYIVSEINSSLRAEGVHSSRKVVEQVVKDIREGVKRDWSEVESLISNYYETLRFILKKPEINERNLYFIYSSLTANIRQNIIEDESFYRKGEVTIGMDLGIEPNKIKSSIHELINFINEEDSLSIHTKAIVAHYIFENIHPYYDYNGRIGRILHLWILVSKSFDYFWELVYLSEAVYSYKIQFDKTFDHILKAKKNLANIDLNYWVASIYDILISHSESYVLMKQLVSRMKKTPSRFIRLFIIDMLCQDKDLNQWYTINDFKKNYPDYSTALYGKILVEIRESNLFDLQEGSPIKFRVKREYVKATI